MRSINLNHPQYPPSLKEINSPPKTIYYQGDLSLLNKNCISVVGPRKCSAYGRRVAEEFVAELVNNDFCIVSGLAMGIDAIAHQQALNKNGTTIAVLGGGIDCAYPASNHHLYQSITKNGLIISEYPPETPGYKSHYPARNRIVSGISVATLVIEAPKRSGSLITANFAFDQQREVYAVPGSIYSSSTEGIHHLISTNKAKLVHSPEHLLSELQASTQLTIPFGTKKRHNDLNDQEQELIDLLRATPMTANEISTHQQTSLTSVFNTLTQLEIKQLVKKQPGSLYIAL